MNWFNPAGLVSVLILLVPNIIFAMKNKDGFENKYQNKAVEALEQVGRFGCFILMFVSLPKVTFGFWFDGGKAVYVILSSVLLFLYCLGWVVFKSESSVRKSLYLSIVPSLLFLESGVLTLNLPLLALSVVFAVCHITISYKNAVL